MKIVWCKYRDKYLICDLSANTSEWCTADEVRQLAKTGKINGVSEKNILDYATKCATYCEFAGISYNAMFYADFPELKGILKFQMPCPVFDNMIIPNPNNVSSIYEKSAFVISMSDLGDSLRRFRPWSLELDKLHTSQVVDFSKFMSHQYLSSESFAWGADSHLDFNVLDTSSAVNMSQMFYNGHWKTLDASKFNVSNVENVSEMFASCLELRSVNVSNWHFTKPVDLTGMFRGCEYLQSVDFSGWSLPAVTSMQNMFKSCHSLEEIDLSFVNFQDIYNSDEGLAVFCNNMFEDCVELKSLYVRREDVEVLTEDEYTKKVFGLDLQVDVEVIGV